MMVGSGLSGAIEECDCGAPHNLVIRPTNDVSDRIWSRTNDVRRHVLDEH
jgi:hypothetical protein